MDLFNFEKPLFNFDVNKPLKLFEAFSGYGSQAMALKRLGINVHHVGISEINKHAINGYMAVHGEVKNYGNIMDIKGKDLCDIDMFTYSFPCTDLSKAGKQLGMSNETRSGLVFEVLRILSEMENKPQVLLMENVPDLLSPKFKDGWHRVYNEIESMGYSNHVFLMNAKDYGIAQNRNRVFMVSIKGDYTYKKPEPYELKKFLKDYLEPLVDEKYYLTTNQINQITNWKSQQNPINDSKTIEDPTIQCITAKSNTSMNAPMLLIREATIKGYAEACDGDGIYINRPHQKRGVVQKGMIQTIKTSPDVGVVVYDDFNSKISSNQSIFEPITKNLMITDDGNIKRYLNSDIVDQFEVGDCADISFPNGYNKGNRVFKGYVPSINLTTTKDNFITKTSDLRIRKLTPREALRLMDVSDSDIDKILSIVSNTQAYKLAGNSIVVNVLVEIFKNLF